MFVLLREGVSAALSKGRAHGRRLGLSRPAGVCSHIANSLSRGIPYEGGIGSDRRKTVATEACPADYSFLLQ